MPIISLDDLLACLEIEEHGEGGYRAAVNHFVKKGLKRIHFVGAFHTTRHVAGVGHVDGKTGRTQIAGDDHGLPLGSRANGY